MIIKKEFFKVSWIGDPHAQYSSLMVLGYHVEVVELQRPMVF
jgi:hypothetical protein